MVQLGNGSNGDLSPGAGRVESDDRNNRESHQSLASLPSSRQDMDIYEDSDEVKPKIEEIDPEAVGAFRRGDESSDNAKTDLKPAPKSKLDQIFEFDKLGFKTDLNEVIDLAQSNPGSRIHPKLSNRFLTNNIPPAQNTDGNLYRIRNQSCDFTSPRH
jgi:hypothetical protein